MDVAEKKIRSRFSRKPLLTPGGKPKSIPPDNLTTLELEVLKALARDRFLSSDYLAGVVGSSYRYMVDLTAVLRSPPNAYIKICDQQNDPRTEHLYLTTKLQFELTELGRHTLFDRFGIKIPERKPIRNIVHQVMGDHYMASMRIGARRSEGRFILLDTDELLKHENVPEKTRTSPFPGIIPLGENLRDEEGKPVRDKNGQPIPHVIRPDRDFHVLRDTEKNLAYFFATVESGTGSETHQGKRHDHSFTESKFEDCLTVLEKRIYETRYGADNCFFVFLEPYLPRIYNEMDILADMTQKKKWARPSFHFKLQHTFTDREKPMADGSALTKPALVVGEDGKPTTFSIV